MRLCSSPGEVAVDSTRGTVRHVQRDTLVTQLTTNGLLSQTYALIFVFALDEVTLFLDLAGRLEVREAFDLLWATASNAAPAPSSNPRRRLLAWGSNSVTNTALKTNPYEMPYPVL